MKDPDGRMKGDKHRGGGHKGRHHHHGAQTFRRGRALEFLERLKVNRATIKQQLDAAEFQEIRPILLGELKAIESVIDQYTQHFEIREIEGEEGQAEEEEGNQ
ncbi:hypothetical protein ACFPES_09210 [Paenibacillus sp. GCM10023248]|uniref:hypothetical protein n=1 Tax=Bacillales TaxID=1385 RepID=UPI002378B171|nr:MULTISPECIES: hypothetical protein [Bacillales]MDD9267198.1 hypothetical protein [Paenibacillus sp. MAHUQ-63]MDR6881407.1 hypothetical protein [Bacillus sp. 3255]